MRRKSQNKHHYNMPTSLLLDIGAIKRELTLLHNIIGQDIEEIKEELRNIRNELTTARNQINTILDELEDLQRSLTYNNKEKGILERIKEWILGD